MKDGMLEIGDQVHFRKRKGGAVSYGTVVAIQYVSKTHDGRTAANIECCSKYANTMPPRKRSANCKQQERQSEWAGFFSRFFSLLKKRETK